MARNMTQDLNRMLKSLRAKTYRNLQEERAAGSNASLISDNIVDRTEGKGGAVVSKSKLYEAYTSETPWHQAQVKQQQQQAPPATPSSASASVAPLCARGRSASEPSFLSASRAVKVRPVASPVASSRSSYTPPAVKEISSITGLQQQIKAAFGRWRKRGSPHGSGGSSGSSQQQQEEEAARIRDDDTFEHPLNVRLSPHSQTFSHPHRLTVFPPFPSPSSSASGNSGTGHGSQQQHRSPHHPFSFVRGLRKRRSEQSERGAGVQHGDERVRSRADWSSPTSTSAAQRQELVGPLTSKSRSDHSLHRILKDDNTWTVFATLRSPCEKGETLSKGSTAWTFGLFSDSTHSQRRQAANKSKGKASSVAPSPELLHRSFTPPAGSQQPAFGRNERRTRSLERCSGQRVRPLVQQQQPATCKPPPVPSRVRSRSLEKNYTLSTTQKAATPLLPSRRTQVPPEILATWCTFNEAFGGNRPLRQSNEDSPGSPVFEELFLPPPHRFASSPAPVQSSNAPLVLSSAPVSTASPAVPTEALQIVENKRNSVSCSCSSRSTPRSSPVPQQPETVLYGSREAPVLERHCVEGGEFIIAWLSHSNQKSGSPSGQRGSSVSSGGSSNHEMPATLGGVGAGAGRGAGGGAGGQSFVNKPARGWLHSDQVIVREGINYYVRYIGCLEVNTSMKSLDFDTRSQIAKECINIVCETAGLKTVDKKRKVDRRIQRILGDAPHMEHAGSDVALTISSDCLRISTLEGSAVVACHDMPNISFASGGDPDTLDFVAYVAKDNVHGRACYVLECGGGLAQDVITTIGQAFELRFKEYLKRTPRPGNELHTAADSASATGPAAGSGASSSVAAAAAASVPAPPWSPDDPEYYNDLPGKVPPDVGPPPVPPLPNYHAPGGGAPNPSGATTTASLAKKGAGRVDLSDNLIDLNSDVAAEASSTSNALPAFADHEYVNGIVGSTGEFKSSSVSKDPFDMHPFSAALPSPLIPPSAAGSRSMQQRVKPASKARSAIEAQLAQELWFHGPISRKEAEDLLKHDGDFLVRESQGSPGQYVLTGMQSGHHKHLLLVDPEGVVRTKDRTFESVSHLINFHRNNVLPIISAESVLLLKRPVARAHHA